MRASNRVLTVFFIAVIASTGVHADSTPKESVSNEKVQLRDGSKNTDSPKPDCTGSHTDPRCGQQRPRYPHQAPYPAPHYPDRYRQRPVIINQLPEEPAIEINTLTDDWEGCRNAKLGAIKARRSGRSSAANDLDDWLWKNCRSYSNELRQLEQDDM